MSTVKALVKIECKGINATVSVDALMGTDGKLLVVYNDIKRMAERIGIMRNHPFTYTIQACP